MKDSLTEKELVSRMLNKACEFVEFHESYHMYFYRFYGYQGKSPYKFHPGTSDKLILRKLIEERVKQIPEDWRINHNVSAFAHRVLFWDYYPAYDNLNRINQD